MSETKRILIADLKRSKRDGFQSTYSNHLEVLPGFYDARVVFAQIIKDEGDAPTVELQSAVTLSWEHILRFRDLLSRNIEKYELEHGPIRTIPEPIPPGE